MQTGKLVLSSQVSYIRTERVNAVRMRKHRFVLPGGLLKRLYKPLEGSRPRTALQCLKPPTSKRRCPGVALSIQKKAWDGWAKADIYTGHGAQSNEEGKKEGGRKACIYAFP